MARQFDNREKMADLFFAISYYRRRRGMSQEQLAEEFFYLELRDETRLPEDLWARAGEDSLRGLFLQRMRRRFQQGDQEEKEKVEQAVRFALAALDHRDL